MKTHTILAIALSATTLSGCELAELATPESGSCSSAIEANAWPKFTGTEGIPPVIPEPEIGWAEGLIPPDFELPDQFGEATCLWQMTGHYVVLDLSALWCEPCKEIAKTVACTQEAYGDELVYMTFISEDTNSLPADMSHAKEWSDAFGLGEGTWTPVIADGDKTWVSAWPGPGTLPTLLLLGPDLRLISVGTGAEAELQIRNRLESLTGLDADACHSE